jgi:hypothetical protein
MVGGVGAASWALGGLERGGVSPEGALDPSSEAETHQRGCQALERGVDSPKAASGPRVRQRLMVRYLALERDRDSLKGYRGR